jgi:hypothetical protein
VATFRLRLTTARGATGGRAWTRGPHVRSGIRGRPPRKPNVAAVGPGDAKTVKLLGFRAQVMMWSCFGWLASKWGR